MEAINTAIPSDEIKVKKQIETIRCNEWPLLTPEQVRERIGPMVHWEIRVGKYRSYSGVGVSQKKCFK